MLKKENLPPIKQGVFYQLNLSKNSGPFLAKDIMFNNPKSNMLLTNHEMHHQHQKMMQTLSHLEKTGKMQPSNETKIDSFNTIIQNCELELSACLKVSKSLQAAEIEFKGQIECLYDKVSNINNQLIESSLPVLKNLMKKVKEVNQADKAEYYKISKELQNIEMQKRSLEYIVLNCKNRIEELEKHFGVVNQFFQRTRSLNGFMTPPQFE